MFYGVNFPGVIPGNKSDDSVPVPPAADSGKGESTRCDWCNRQTVSRPGGFCKNWDQIFGCPHEAEAEAHIMKDD